MSAAHNPPPDPTSGYIGRLADLLSDDAGALILATLQKLRLASTPHRNAEPGQPDAPTHVGVWQTVETPAGPALQRDPALEHDYRRWADVDLIPPKQHLRVVLVGESAARGYLFDPVVTFAGLVESALRASWSAAGATTPSPEVIDLAKAGATMTELHELVALLPTVRPDAVLLFAGNNWANTSLTVPELDHLARALRLGGYAEARLQFLEHILVPRARALLETLGAQARASGFAVVVVVPEFNLGDWQPEPGVVVPILAESSLQHWMQDRTAAEQALRDGDHGSALGRARTMIAADHDTSAVSHGLAGRALAGLGRDEEARRHFESARDALCGSLLKHTPRCPAHVQDTLRCVARQLGFGIVDMPQLFRTRLAGGIPDRRLFMDYCHLTLAGLRIVATEAGRQLALALGTPAPPGRLVRRMISREDDGVAHVLAAIHCAHYGQGRPLLEYHCTRAARLSRTARAVMQAFLDFEGRAAPHWMSASYHRACEHPMVRRYLAATVPRMIDKLADFALREAMLLALETTTAGRGRAEEHRHVQEQGRPVRVDLLAYRNRATTFRARDGFARVPEKAYVQATDMTSRFYLVRARSERLQLLLTHRAPLQEAEAPLAVQVNEVEVGVTGTGPTWRTWRIEVPAERTVVGVNVIDLVWPAAEPLYEAEIEKAARRMEMGELPEVLPVFGEVHGFAAISGGSRDGD